MALIVTVYKKALDKDRDALYFKCNGQFYKLSICQHRYDTMHSLMSKFRAFAREMFFKSTDLTPYQCSGEGLIFTGARFNASAYRLLPEFKAPRRGHEVSRLSRGR